MGVLDKPIQSDSKCFCISPSHPSTYNGSFVEQDSQNNRQRQTTHENDVLISEAMQKLTFQEREQQEEVLHGVDKDIPEGEEFVKNALQELESHLVQQRSLGSAYELAERMDPDYVHGRSFRIMFLRGNRYDTKATANQMLKFFEMKRKIFGTEKLSKDITIEDLDPDDILALKSGLTQLCGRDRSGRMIVVQLPSLISFRSVKSEMRARYFFLMNALKSEQTQVKGFIFITYAVGEYKNFRTGTAGFNEIVEVSYKSPIFVAAIHFCCDDLREYLVCNLVLKATPMKLRTRIRVHHGSHLECQYRLSTYGIHKRQLPFEPNTFSPNRKRHLDWFQTSFRDKSSLNKLSTVENTPTFIEPNANDVLYMNGNRSNNGGNLHLRNLVAECSDPYGAGTNETKRQVVNGIISKIHETGGRFLSQADGPQLQPVWIVLSTDQVRLKITQAFRNHRRKVNRHRSKGTWVSPKSSSV